VGPSTLLRAGVTEQLCAILSGIDFGALPQPVVERTLQAIADGIAVAIAGCDEAPVKLMSMHVRRLGAKPVSSVWGHGFRTSPVHAAYVNGMAIHVLDFEPMWSPPTHSVSPTVPVAFALAQARRSSGEQVVTAIAKGMELQSRLQLAGNQYEPEQLRFHPPGVAGVMGAAVTAAHMLQLDALRLRHALGIAASRCGALLANVGTMTKATHCGGAGAAGLDAALLAEAGFTANADIIEAPKGVVQTFYPESFDPAKLLAYADPWRVVDPGLAIKLYPSQYATHFAITAALELRQQVGFDAEMEALEITAPVMHYIDRPAPASGLDGKFSLQYTTAVALLDGRVTIESFTDRRLASADMQGMLKRTTLVQDPTIPGEWTRMWIEIEATMHGGRRHRARSHGPNGCWGQAPVGFDEHRQKLRDCLGRKYSPHRAERLLASIEALARAGPEDLSKLIALLSAVRV
jgi:aconitate decarboxylase